MTSEPCDPPTGQHTTGEKATAEVFIPKLIDTKYTPKRVEHRFIVARWRDPFSRQGPSVECVKWCQITPWDKWCCGHAYKWKYLDVDLVVKISVPEVVDAKKALDECLQQAAIAAALAAILVAIATGGAALAAAIEAFKVVLIACLTAKLADALVRVEQESKWTDWE